MKSLCLETINLTGKLSSLLKLLKCRDVQSTLRPNLFVHSGFGGGALGTRLLKALFNIPLLKDFVCWGQGVRGWGRECGVGGRKCGVGGRECGVGL